METEEKLGSKRGLIIGAVLGGASLLALTCNKQVRHKVRDKTKQAITKVNDTTVFIAENREDILKQVKEASNHLSGLLKSANEDIQLITNKASHLKEVTKSVKDTTQQTATEIKELNKQQDT